MRRDELEARLAEHNTLNAMLETDVGEIDAKAKAAKQATPPAAANRVATPGVGIRPASQRPAPASVVTPVRTGRR